jgi:hypothetical protein
MSDEARERADDARSSGTGGSGPHGSGTRGATVARLVLLLAGLALVATGVQGFFRDHYLQGRHLDVLKWSAGTIVVHDGLWTPCVLLAGLLLTRFVPAFARGPVRLGLITAAALSAVGLPAVIRRDEHNGNPTLLPLPYLRNYLLLLLGTAVLVLVLIAAKAVTRRKVSGVGAAAGSGPGSGSGEDEDVELGKPRAADPEDGTAPSAGPV